MSARKQGRRRFLKNAALAGLAAGAGSIGDASAQTLASEKTETQLKDLHAYGDRSRYENGVRTGTMGDMFPPGGLAPDAKRDFGLRTPLQKTVGFITPASLHYVI